MRLKVAHPVKNLQVFEKLNTNVPQLTMLTLIHVFIKINNILYKAIVYIYMMLYCQKAYWNAYHTRKQTVVNLPIKSFHTTKLRTLIVFEYIHFHFAINHSKSLLHTV